MEIMDLEVCDFVQYRPGGDWITQEYDSLEIPRDREWFSNALPIMKEFWDRVLARRASMISTQSVLEDKAARLIQWAHRGFREDTCRPEGIRSKEASRNLRVALRQFRDAKRKHSSSLESTVKSRKRRKVPVVVTIDVSDLVSGVPPGYGIDDDII